mmetsp:Transcript_49066/g.59412  ORF Transcript_49066/g.59412 Transcript_49066/m.59412 type:complete len:1407 (+) Transcript_49066:34-4254(+)|eukprot:CAMPEP_0172483554 /NCGR_PEP_ID=MMETSP1066-20121228/10541_1 /TAXON_ID=671091 /ORGANISM="Coscinodiscus wailesii, Strain CCMP2513" /LENGTH=1406 /DNA_ID=CAMNT_0013247469 /DNA_START=27 /DNA_END=4247 /DNA_ORIENTATION=+
MSTELSGGTLKATGMVAENDVSEVDLEVGKEIITHDKTTKTETNSKTSSPPMASARELFSFGTDSQRTRACLALGTCCAVISGLVIPASAFFFARVFETLGATTGGSEFLSSVRTMAIVFVTLGVFGFTFVTLQSAFFETAATAMSKSLKTEWFHALLRQDIAYYDLMDVSNTASSISTSAAKYKLGVGRKLGELVQFTIVIFGGFIYAFYASWQASLIILTTLPVMSAGSLWLANANKTQSSKSQKAYSEAGGIVYSTVSALKTVLSLNAVQDSIDNFESATEKAYKAVTSSLIGVGLANGSMMSGFLVSYVALTLYGSYLLYSAVMRTGCDPSGGVPDNVTCAVTGADVFGALMGISFGAIGLPQVGVAIEAITKARVACYPAIQAINRKLGSGKANDKAAVEKYYKLRKDDDTDDAKDGAGTKKSRQEEPVILPEYHIDSSSTEGLKPKQIVGTIKFENVKFAYPSRPTSTVFDNFSITIPAGKTVGLVGASGSGKSTVTALIERFYDPQGGSIRLDGNELKTMNVSYLRSNIGLVGQEPVLFATSIAENIRHGQPSATQQDIEEAAKKANAHDFIMSFPDGYDTQVGDKGAQLSGGQKQRIAIARVIVRNPQILILDEATSALDSESELVVQRALDNLLKSRTRTTIVIAHRLSTIRDVDIIACVKKGKVVETGTHDSLMDITNGHYKKLVHAQTHGHDNDDTHATDMQPSIEDVETGTTMADAFDSSQKSFKVVKSSSTKTTPLMVFQNVYFTYPSRPKSPIFTDLNLTLYEGETLALVGPSGHGKSSIVSLLERFYDIASGSIEFYGNDIRNLNVKWLRNQIGLVSQEPVLFNTTIAKNISLGCPGLSQENIEDAARQANAHNFITAFPDGYETFVGERGTQVSGGQKQRISIARAIVRKPRILVLDEATSALDTQSEKVVQEALDNVMASAQQTTLVIAHRLSTIRNADRIAVVANGQVAESGNYQELMDMPNGRFKRLTMLQTLKGNARELAMKELFENHEQDNAEKNKSDSVEDGTSHSPGNADEKSPKEAKEEDKKTAKRARVLAMKELPYFSIGAVGSILAGLVFPSWGILFAYMIRLLFRPVFYCDEAIVAAFGDYNSCNDYYNAVASSMRSMSYTITWCWFGVMGINMLGNVLLFYGFVTASERMNRRIRNAAFTSLVRQECAYFDTRTVGSITSNIQEDTAMLHSFASDPIRVLMMNLASVFVGLIVSFIYMWPFALLTLVVLPFMAFGSYMETKMFLEQTSSDVKEGKGESSTGGILLETLLNIRTIASLSMENARYNEYVTALDVMEQNRFRANLFKGTAYGVSQITQNCGLALMFWWGGWLMSNYPELYTFESFLISMFSLLFSLSGLGIAAQGITSRDKATEAAKHIFEIIDRKTTIDPLSDEGKKLD